MPVKMLPVPAGLRFGSLVTTGNIRRDSIDSNRVYSKVEVTCDCGVTKWVLQGALARGAVKSCGCTWHANRNKPEHIAALVERSTTHGCAARTKTHRLYNIYRRMRQRCEDEGCTDYAAYGGRGIAVCEDWKEFAPFLDWANSNGYGPTLMIDRIENDGPYSADNCRWVTPVESARNKRNNHRIEFRGETKTLAEWSELLKMESSLLRYRLKNWTLYRAFMEPVRKQSR